MPASLAGPAAVQDEAVASWSQGQTWFAWCPVTGTSVTMNDTAWASWNNGVATASGSFAYNYPSGTSYVSSGTQWTALGAAWPEDEDQRAAREEYERQVRADWQARYEEQEREREQARRRSLELLRSLLSDGQWASYREKGWFEVRGSSGRRWRIRSSGQAGNVDLMPETGGERDATYCAHPPDGLPDPDAHAAQMLALVTDDEAFVRVANTRWARPGLEERRDAA